MCAIQRLILLHKEEPLINSQYSTRQRAENSTMVLNLKHMSYSVQLNMDMSLMR